MENENLGEQPIDVQPSFEENSSGSPQIEENLSAVTGEAEKGVPIGKFKNVNDLFEAYNNLQAEFTRKSQRLSELEKDKTLESQSFDKKQNAFNEFLSKNQEACSYVNEIRSRLNESQCSEEDIEKVWAGILYEKLCAPNRINEPLFKNLILNDDQVQKVVVENYLKNLGDKPPIVISSNSGEKVTKPTLKKPDTFEEAKKVVIDLLN